MLGVVSSPFLGLCLWVSFLWANIILFEAPVPSCYSLSNSVPHPKSSSFRGGYSPSTPLGHQDQV